MDRGSGRAPRLGLVGLLAGGLALSGCSLFGPSDRARAEDEAARVASALSASEPGRLSFRDGSSARAQSAWDAATKGLGAGSPAVRTVAVSKASDGDDWSRATARVSYRWKLPGASKPWTYRASVPLVEKGDRWVVARFAPSMVQPDLRAGERLVRSTSLAPRADILGARDQKLVQPRRVLRVGVDRSLAPVARAVASARALARVVDIDATSYARRVRAAGAKAFVEAIVLRPGDAGSMVPRASALSGVRVVEDTLPLAPTREFARPILGTVGPVSAEIVKKSGGVYAAGDEAGLTGLQGRYDEQLRGTPGVRVQAVAASGVTRVLLDVDPTPGTALRTTLDERLQKQAEQALAGTVPASALVAIRPSTGDLLAVASGPGGGGLSTATVGHYAPGSTFKVVSSLALLRAGVRPSTVLSCPPTTVVDGKRFKNYSDYPPGALGRISLGTAVANSCNTAFIGARGRVSQAEVAKAAASLGLGVDHDLGFPAYFGSVPASDADAGGETGHAASMIGQGKVVASPMAMAAVAASVARGRTVVPRLLLQQKTDSTSSDPVTAREAASLRGLMRGVVTQGSGSFLASVPGAPVLAKTGTAEFGDRAPLQTHAWMIAVHGDLAVAVFLDVGESGSRTAGPILDRFLRAAG